MSVTSLINPETETDEAKGKQVKEGFADAAGAIPRVEHIGESDLDFRAQGELVERIQNRTTRKARAQSTTTQVSRGDIKEPEIPTQPVYGKNRVIRSQGGHLIELDDSPGRERINITHRNGSKVEIRPNGTIKLISQKDRYSAIAGNEELVVRGNTNLVLESDATVRVGGDLDLQVEGDMNALVEGNYTLEVEGDLTERVHGNVERKFTGTYLRDIRGSVTERNLSNYLCWNVGTYTMNIGGAYDMTTEATMRIVSDDEITMECEGGYIDISSPDSAGDNSYIVTGTTYVDNDQVAENVYAAEVHADSGFLTDLDVSNVIEAEAKKATFADSATQANTAGTAGGLGAGGSASPTTPSPTSPTNQEAPTKTTLEAEDVAETSDGFISDLDRSTYYDNKYNKRKLNTYEVWSRMNNENLRRDSTWMQDQVDYGAILDSATSSSTPVAQRTFSINNNNVGVGTTKIGNKFVKDRAFKLEVPNKPIVDVIPEQYKITTATRKTQLSRNFTMANLLGGDSQGAQLIEQAGLSTTDIAKNAQFLAFNVLEKFRDQFQDRWSISQGMYNLLDQEKLNSSSVNKDFLQGLAVGIQFDESDKSIYFDAAVWAAKNLVFDKIVLSYIDYDPEDINEPTLIITLANGNNSKTLETHFNNERVASELQDLTD